MDEIVNEAAILFNINVNGCSRAKATFILDAENGRMVLKKQYDIRKIEALYKATEALRRNGFKSAERFLTACGKPYAALSDGIYTVSVCGEGGKCDFANISDTAAIAKTVAMLHNACDGLNAPDIAKSKSVTLRYYEKRLAEARHIKKWLDRRSRLSDIDVLYIKKFSDYLEVAGQASKRISEYIGSAALLMCVGEFKEDNILIDESKESVTLLNLENCVMSAPGTDLCQLIRRFVKRGGNAALINEIISAYCSERKLAKTDTDFIKAYLSFPHKFFKITNKYYNSRRVYGNSHAFFKLNAETAYQDTILEVLNTI